MKYERFLKLSEFASWLAINGFETCHITTSKDRVVLLVYSKNIPYGIAIEANSDWLGDGYDVITDISTLPCVEYQILPENTTISKVLNKKAFVYKVNKIVDIFDESFRQ